MKNLSTITWLKGSIFFQMATNGAISFLPLYWRQDCGFSESQIGLISAFGLVGAIVGPLAFGKLSERIALDRLIYLSFLVYGVLAFTHFGWRTQIGQTVLYSALSISSWGFYTLVPVCVVAVLASNGNNQPGRDYGRYRRYGSVGYLIGSCIVGFLSDHWGFLPYFLLLGLLPMLAAVPFFSKVKHAPSSKKNTPSYLKLCHDKRLLLLLFVEFFSSAMIPAAFVFLPLRMNELGASNTLTGVAIAATGFFSILFYSKIGKFCDRFDLSGLYCVMLVSVALRTVLISLPSVDPRWFLVIQIMEVPTWLLRDVLRIKYLDSFVSEERRPKTQALIALVSYSGSAVCAAAASGLLQVVSLQQMFVYHAFIPLLGLPFAIYLWKLGFKR